MASNWYYQISGEEYGPATPSELVRLVREGRITRSDLVRKGESGEWIDASRVKGLFDTPPPAIEPAARPKEPPEEYQLTPPFEADGDSFAALSDNPHDAPQNVGTVSSPGRSGRQPPSNGLAITSMVLGIVAITSGCCCGLLSIPLAIAAIITGSIALSKVRSGTAEGKGMAMAGLICGIVAVVLSIGFTILALVFNVPDIMQELQQMQ